MIGLPLATWTRLIVWLAVGLVIYFTYGHQRAVVSTAVSGD
jgi:APA family basic amino acid/polyamine antiporter